MIYSLRNWGGGDGKLKNTPTILNSLFPESLLFSWTPTPLHTWLHLFGILCHVLPLSLLHDPHSKLQSASSFSPVRLSLCQTLPLPLASLHPPGPPCCEASFCFSVSHCSTCSVSLQAAFIYWPQCLELRYI